MPDLTVPPGVWTALPDGSTVLNESGANAVVTIECGEIRFSAAMRWRRAAPQLVYAVVHGNYQPREVLAVYDNAEAAERHVERESRSGWHLEVSQWVVETAYFQSRLTAADPEPPRGSTVEGPVAGRWTRTTEPDTDYWLRDDATSDPESWNKVAGNYGPVKVIKWGEDDA